MATNTELARMVQAYVRQGYVVLAQTETSAQLVKRKQFSFLIAVIALLLAVFPFILYVLWYMAAKDETIYLTVEANGRVKKVRG